jgi:hypothetical protein
VSRNHINLYTVPQWPDGLKRNIYIPLTYFFTCSHSREKRLLPSSCLFVYGSVVSSVRLSTCISAATKERTSMKFDIGDFLKIYQDSLNLVEIGHKYRPLYTKPYVLLPFSAALNRSEIASGCWEGWGGINITRTARYCVIRVLPVLYPASIAYCVCYTRIPLINGHSWWYSACICLLPCILSFTRRTTCRKKVAYLRSWKPAVIRQDINDLQIADFISHDINMYVYIRIYYLYMHVCVKCSVSVQKLSGPKCIFN